MKTAFGIFRAQNKNSDEALVESYKRMYCMPASAPITLDMAYKHWKLELYLTNELLASSLANRWETWERCYTKLYDDLWWLNKFGEREDPMITAQAYRNWTELIGSPPKKIYEVGSGKGNLIRYLACYGFECKGTEITHERGNKTDVKNPNLSWAITDGVNLSQFDKHCCYDYVISDQVIEHLHPADLQLHFENVYKILTKEGKLIFRTPHRFFGPSDISALFNLTKSHGMHLREYTFAELRQKLERAKFKKIFAVFIVPPAVSKITKVHFKALPSQIYLNYLCFLENVLTRFPNKQPTRKISKFLRLMLFTANITMVAQKAND